LKKLLKYLSYTYLFTWIFVFSFYLYNSVSTTVTFTKVIDSFFRFSTSKTGAIIIHALWIIFFVILLTLKYFISVYKKKGFKTFLKQFSFRLVLPIFVIVFGLKFIIDKNNTEDFNYEWKSSFENNTGVSNKLFLKDNKLRGMNVFRIGRRNNNRTVDELIKTNIEWVALLPYFYQETENSKKINTPEKIGIWSKRDSSFINDINKLHEKEIFVMLKPHLWMSTGWRSNINFDDNKDWEIWFSEYRKNMIHYALMAQKTNVELFCIGTELKSSLKQMPNEWLSLIKEIKTIYKGKITYAANWDDSFEFLEFWNTLDYIGIQAYYPLTKNKNPSLEEIKNGWDIHIEKLEGISSQFDKKIIFTEFGYRNDASATIEPCVWGSFFQRLYTKKSDKTQVLAYQALYEKVWNQPWFAGTFPWEWNSSDFPIYKKPAQNMITIWYSDTSIKKRIFY
jgi:hypothetical protein